MRLAPVGARGVAEEPALDRIAQRRGAHEPERALASARPVRAGVREEAEHRGDRELRGSPEAAVQAVLVGGEARRRRGASSCATGRSPAVGATDAAARASTTASAVLSSSRRRSRHASSTAASTCPNDGTPRSGLRREVGAGVERAPVGRREHRERPAELARERRCGGEVAGVDVGMLLAVDLDRDEAAR